ncbi:MAG: M23 family metallopeptidase [Chloroflexi bacterium]|nr:M23 family metallopeptidase [Chloroflexota bacterium]
MIQATPIKLSFFARVRIRLAPMLLQLRDRAHEQAQDIPGLTRAASHISVIGLIALIVSASAFPINLSAKNNSVSSLSSTDTSDAAFDPDFVPETPDFLARAAIPVTNIPKRVRRDVLTYTVKSGDTVSNIGDDFEVSADSILWANPKLEDNPDLLSVGQTLNIPPVSGVLYTVQANDTVQKLAEKFKSAKQKTDDMITEIVNLEFNKTWHDLKAPDYAITPGKFLMIPGGSKPYQPRVVYAYNGPTPPTAAKGSGLFGWPVTGVITQKFWAHHPGIDIGAPKGAHVFAADSGFVISSGWSSSGYGYQILLSHGNGYVTRYAHLSSMQVQAGDSVKKGEWIGNVGSSGNSTGPHLHFEIIQGNGHRNPFALLPGR